MPMLDLWERHNSATGATEQKEEEEEGSRRRRHFREALAKAGDTLDALGDVAPAADYAGHFTEEYPPLKEQQETIAENVARAMLGAFSIPCIKPDTMSWQSFAEFIPPYIPSPLEPEQQEQLASLATPEERQTAFVAAIKRDEANKVAFLLQMHPELANANINTTVEWQQPYDHDNKRAVALQNPLMLAAFLAHEKSCFILCQTLLSQENGFFNTILNPNNENWQELSSQGMEKTANALDFAFFSIHRALSTDARVALTLNCLLAHIPTQDILDYEVHHEPTSSLVQLSSYPGGRCEGFHPRSILLFCSEYQLFEVTALLTKRADVRENEATKRRALLTLIKKPDHKLRVRMGDWGSDRQANFITFLKQHMPTDWLFELTVTNILSERTNIPLLLGAANPLTTFLLLTYMLRKATDEQLLITCPQGDNLLAHLFQGFLEIRNLIEVVQYLSTKPTHLRHLLVEQTQLTQGRNKQPALTVLATNAARGEQHFATLYVMLRLLRVGIDINGIMRQALKPMYQEIVDMFALTAYSNSRLLSDLTFYNFWSIDHLNRAFKNANFCETVVALRGDHSSETDTQLITATAKALLRTPVHHGLTSDRGHLTAILTSGGKEAWLAQIEARIDVVVAATIAANAEPTATQINNTEDDQTAVAIAQPTGTTTASAMWTQPASAAAAPLPRGAAGIGGDGRSPLT